MKTTLSLLLSLAMAVIPVMDGVCSTSGCVSDGIGVVTQMRGHKSESYELAGLIHQQQGYAGSSPVASTIFIPMPMFGQAAELPAWIPPDIQRQIQIVIESSPDVLMGWATFIVIVVIVVVSAVILYCLWKCSQMIPPPVTTPPPPPEDPAFVDMPHAFLYNTTPTETIYFQISKNSYEWTSFRLLEPKTETMELYFPPSDRMFFRLESR